MASSAVSVSDLQNCLPLITRGKVRDLYDVDDETLLFVATDRISAFDVIMANAIPGKGELLTRLTTFWFKILCSANPNLQTHFITLDLPDIIPQSHRPQLQNRSMQVRKLKVFQIEAIVRGYITGSAWLEYLKSGTVHGIPQPKGLRESEAFPEPLYTPSTKASAGEKDENIHPSEASALVGVEHASKIEALALALYKTARDYAAERGVIIADTKFEFGQDEGGEVVLVDEVLTPDSSRFWDADKYEVGRSQESFDKQFLRDWLVREGLKGKDGVEIPHDVVMQTVEKYKEAYKRLVGKTSDVQ